MNSRPKIALFRGTGVVSSLIRLQTRSIYTHAAILLPYTDRKVIESREFKGVRIHEYSEQEWEKVDLFDVAGMTDADWNTALDFAHHQLGLKYDYWSVARFVSKRPARENNRWFCSELVHKAVAESGVRLLLRIPSAEVSPGALALSPLLIGVSADIPKCALNIS